MSPEMAQVYTPADTIAQMFFIWMILIQKGREFITGCTNAANTPNTTIKATYDHSILRLISTDTLVL